MTNNYVKVTTYELGRITSCDVHTFDCTDPDECAGAEAIASLAPEGAQVSVYRPFCGLPVVGVFAREAAS